MDRYDSSASASSPAQTSARHSCLLATYHNVSRSHPNSTTNSSYIRSVAELRNAALALTATAKLLSSFIVTQAIRGNGSQLHMQIYLIYYVRNNQCQHAPRLDRVHVIHFNNTQARGSISGKSTSSCWTRWIASSCSFALNSLCDSLNQEKEMSHL